MIDTSWEAVKIKKKYPELNLDLSQHSYEGRVYRVDAEAAINEVEDKVFERQQIVSVLIELLSIVVGRERAEHGSLLEYYEPKTPHIKKIKLIAAP